MYADLVVVTTGDVASNAIKQNLHGVEEISKESHQRVR